MAESDLEQLMIIWTSKVRTELHNCILDRLQKLGQSFITVYWIVCSSITHYWSQETVKLVMEYDGYNHFIIHYECLKDEISVGGVFVRGLAAGQWESFGLPAGHDFLDALLDYLETNQHILDAESDLTSIDEDYHDAFEEFLAVIASLKEALKYAVKADRPELISQCRLSLLSTIAIRGHSSSRVQIEVSSIVEVLTEDESGRAAVLQSNLMASLTVKLWDSAASFPDGEIEELLMAILHALRTLSEGIPATFLATNQFATSGVLLPSGNLDYDKTPCLKTKTKKGLELFYHHINKNNNQSCKSLKNCPHT
jgi:DnaJ family protein C protein 13